MDVRFFFHCFDEEDRSVMYVFGRVDFKVRGSALLEADRQVSTGRVHFRSRASRLFISKDLRTSGVYRGAIFVRRVFRLKGVNYVMDSQYARRGMIASPRVIVGK